MAKFLWIVVLLASITYLSSCSRPERRYARQYAIDSLLNAQAHYLMDRKASISKVTMLEGKESKVTITPVDTTAWKKELEIFQVIDAINKPFNRELYKVEEGSDSKSNLQMKSFVTEKNLPLKFVHLYYKRSTHEIRRIEAGYNESNLLYRSVRTVSMEFEQIGETAVLTSYSILGGQKMFLDDSVQYDIKAYLMLGK